MSLLRLSTVWHQQICCGQIDKTCKVEKRSSDSYCRFSAYITVCFGASELPNPVYELLLLNSKSPVQHGTVVLGKSNMEGRKERKASNLSGSGGKTRILTPDTTDNCGWTASRLRRRATLSLEYRNLHKKDWQRSSRNKEDVNGILAVRTIGNNLLAAEETADGLLAVREFGNNLLAAITSQKRPDPHQLVLCSLLSHG
jgi:hypothetical protein